MAKSNAIVKLNSVTVDEILSVKVMTSVADRLPFVEVVVDNSQGMSEDDFGYYDQIEVLMGVAGSESSQFKGVVEAIDKQVGDERRLKVSGRGFAFIFSEAMIDQLTFTTKTSSYIVDNLRTTYGKDGSGAQIITGAGITSTSDSFTRIIKGTTVWDAIMELCLDAGYDAWVDETKDLHYAPREWTSSGVTIDSDSTVFNVKNAAKPVQVVNRVIVYGGGSPQKVGQADDFASQMTIVKYVKTKIVSDSLLTTQTAVDTRALAELTKLVEVPFKIEIQGVGWENINAGQTVTVDLPEWNVSGVFAVLEKEHSYPPMRTVLKLHSYEHSLESTLVEIIRELRKQRQADLTGTITKKLMRFHEFTEASMRVVITKKVPGTSFNLTLGDGGSALGWGTGYGELGWHYTSISTILDTGYG